MSKRLKILAKNSSLTNISIQYGREKIKFNLYEELIVNESRINEELKNQPSYYGFLSLLAVKLKRSMSDKKAELEKIKAELFIEFKEDIDKSTGRPYSNDLAESLVIQEEAYNEALNNFLKAEEEYELIQACVNSFIQRSHLLQSLSANTRKNIE